MSGEPLVTVMGRLGADPEVNFSKEGKAVANFSVGCTPSVRTNDQWVDKDTIWFRVSLWRNAEEFVETATKGALVVVTGKLSVRTYTSKAGEAKTEIGIEADGVGIMPAKKKRATTEPAPW